jgi:hypothetical protein
MHGGIADLPIVPTKSLVSSNSGNFRAKTNLREALECFEEKHQALCFFLILKDFCLQSFWETKNGL